MQSFIAILLTTLEVGTATLSAYGGGLVREPNKPHEKKQLDEAIEAVEYMDQCGMSISRDDIYHLLEGCSKNKDLRAVRRVRSLMNSSGLYSVTVLSDQLIRLFAVCGSLQEADEVFQKVLNPSVFTWNAVMSAHVKLGEAHEALQMYHKMKVEGIKPDVVTFLCILQACSNIGALWQGRYIHAQILIDGHGSSITIGNTLVNMYAKCGDLDDASSVFDKLSDRTVVSWGALLTGYVARGYAITTLELFESMKEEGVKPSRVTYLCALKACASIGAICKGKLVHVEIIKSGLELDCLVGSTLVDMYSKCGSLEDAHKVFDNLPTRDVVSWGAIIVGYAQHGHGEPALELFKQMQQAGVKPGKVAYSSALKACAGLGAIGQGRLLHDMTIRCGLDLDVILGSSIVDFYAKCERLDDARKVFDKLIHRDLVSWGAMIAGYAQHGRGYAALDLFERMQQAGIKPGKATFLSVLKACSSIGALDQGRLLHIEVIKSEIESDSAVGNTLVDMYAKCGNLEEAERVFDDISVRDLVSWGALITGFVVQGHGFPALDLFAKMQQEGLPANEVIYLGALKACGITRSVEHGRLIHVHIIQSELLLDVVVGSTLVDMYVKGGSVEDAHKVFDDLPSRDLVSWGTMMVGYLNQDDGLAAFKLFTAMQEEGLTPDKVTLICGVKACGILGALEWGKWIHTAILESKLESDVVLGSNLIDMFAKCGSLEDAHRVFDGLSSRDAAAWGALIAGYASKGNFTQIQLCLEDMQQQGLKPGDVIFTSILAACSHAGLLEQGCRYFQSMIADHGILPSNEHYSCMVDLFARAGRLDDAKDVLTTAVNLPDALVWRSLLTNCKTYNNMNLARRCFNEVIHLNPCNASGYMLMTNICIAADMWDGSNTIQPFKTLAS